MSWAAGIALVWWTPGRSIDPASTGLRKNRAQSTSRLKGLCMQRNLFGRCSGQSPFFHSLYAAGRGS